MERGPSTCRARISSNLCTRWTAAAATPIPDEIEERFDEKHKAKYFYNKATRKSTWTREEADAVVSAAATARDAEWADDAHQRW